jgi:hypothetical protein
LATCISKTQEQQTAFICKVFTRNSCYGRVPKLTVKLAHFLATSTSTYAKNCKAAAKQDQGVNFVADLNTEISPFNPLPRPRSGTEETRTAQEDPLPCYSALGF